MTLADLSPTRFMNPFLFLKSRRIKRLHQAWEAAKTEVRAAEQRKDTRRIHEAQEAAHKACLDLISFEMAHAPRTANAAQPSPSLRSRSGAR